MSQGTRGAVLNTIEPWARDFDKCSVYWLNGLAGTGKSTIARMIAERLFSDGQLGASFFCSRDSEDRRNIQLIFPTLATQLARKYPEFRSILVPSIQPDPNIAFESLYNQLKKLTVQPLSESDISTVIIIDALDECEDEESASAILSVLGRLLSRIPRVKFFLTGRPEPRICVGFRLPLLTKMTDVFVLHEVGLDQVGSDVRLFFKSSFSELASRLDGLDNWPTEEKLGRLCGRAAGLFVYAAATVKFIDNNRRNPRKQLGILLQSQRIGGREGKILDLLYSSILLEAFGDAEPEYDDMVRSALGAVLLATNPLSPSAIATLLGFDTEDVPPLLSSINSLLILHEAVDRPVLPFHKSFPDFITVPARCTSQRFHLSPPDHHLKLLVASLNFMNHTLEKNMCKLPDAVANSDISELKERAEKYINPALRYACTSWHTHLTDAVTTPAHAPTITTTLRQFLETKFFSGWKYSASSGRSGMRLMHCKSLRVGWRCVGFPCLMPHPNLPRLDPGVDNARPCQRLFSFFNRILRNHHRILSPYLPLSARINPKRINRMETIRVAHPPLHKSCTRSINDMGHKHCGHNIFL